MATTKNKAEIDKLLKQLETAKTPKAKKAIRRMLRSNGHYGGLNADKK